MRVTNVTTQEIPALFDRPLADWAEAIATRIADEGCVLVDEVLSLSPCGDDSSALYLRRMLTESLGYAPGADGYFLQTARAHLATEGQQAENAARLAVYLKEHTDLIPALVGTLIIEADHFAPCE